MHLLLTGSVDVAFLESTSLPIYWSPLIIWLFQQVVERNGISALQASTFDWVLYPRSSDVNFISHFLLALAITLHLWSTGDMKYCHLRSHIPNPMSGKRTSKGCDSQLRAPVSRWCGGFTGDDSGGTAEPGFEFHPT